MRCQARLSACCAGHPRTRTRHEPPCAGRARRCAVHAVPKPRVGEPSRHQTLVAGSGGLATPPATPADAGAAVAVAATFARRSQGVARVFDFIRCSSVENKPREIGKRRSRLCHPHRQPYSQSQPHPHPRPRPHPHPHQKPQEDGDGATHHPEASGCRVCHSLVRHTLGMATGGGASMFRCANVRDIAFHPVASPSHCWPAAARSRMTAFILASAALCAAQQSQAVGDHQQAGAHVGEHGHPHGGVVEQREHQEHRLDAQGQGDVLPQQRMRALR